MYKRQALIERAKHGIFGYSESQEDYFHAIAGWMHRCHHWDVEPDWLIKTPGVVFALAMAVKAFTEAGDCVLIQQPVYYPFSEVIQDNGRVVVSNDLYLGTDNRYHMDLEDFEQKIVEHHVKLFLLCNPHNPSGRVFTREELTGMGEICLKHGVTVVCDEIHNDFVFQGEHTVFASIKKEYADISVTVSYTHLDVYKRQPSTFIPAIYNGVPAKMVGNLWRYAGCYWLIANNDIKDFSDLKGKTIGSCAASGGLRLSVLKMLEANGISEDEVTLVANGKHQTAYATLTSGEVDATIIHNPYAALAEAEGTGHILGRAWDYIPDYYTGTIVASDRIIKEEPEKLQRFLNAYYEVHEKVKNEYFDEFITWLAQQMDVSEDVMRKAVEDEIDVWSDYPVIPEDRVEKTVEYLKEYGWLDENVQAEGTYTNEFAEKAARCV